MLGLFFFFMLIVGGLVWITIKSYNSMQQSAQQVKEFHSNIMAAMKKRADMINQLISVVSGYADHEKLTQITVSGNQTAISDAASLYQQSNATLGRIQAIATSYPDLKANQSYQSLMQEISRVEDLIQDRREKYNAVVRRYNSMRVQFPHALWASKLGFQEAPYFDVENADSLQNLQNFKTDDGEMLRAVISKSTERLAFGVTSGANKLAASTSKMIEHGKAKLSESKNANTAPTSQEHPETDDSAQTLKPEASEGVTPVLLDTNETAGIMLNEQEHG